MITSTDERRALIATALINRGLGSQQAGVWATQMLLELKAAGMVLVPREATKKMVLAGCLSLPHNEQTLLRWQRDPAAKDLELDDMAASWRAMIAAATETVS